MRQITRHFPAPFGDDRKNLTIIYPDEDNSNLAIIVIDDVFQTSVSYDRKHLKFRAGSGSKQCSLSEIDVDRIAELFEIYKMHDGKRWLRIEQPTFSF